jgi:hypothetical protein
MKSQEIARRYRRELVQELEPVGSLSVTLPTSHSALRTAVTPPRLERGTYSLEGCCSIQLSYGAVSASMKVSPAGTTLRRGLEHLTFRLRGSGATFCIVFKEKYSTEKKGFLQSTARLRPGPRLRGYRPLGGTANRPRFAPVGRTFKTPCRKHVIFPL